MKKIHSAWSLLFVFLLTIFLCSCVTTKLAPPDVAAKYKLELQKPIVNGKQVVINGVHNFGAKAKPEWNWGDGTKGDYNMFPGKHSYQKPGTYNVTLTIAEDTPGGRVEKKASTAVTIY